MEMQADYTSEMVRPNFRTENFCVFYSCRFMLYGMISAIGVRNVVENQVDLTKSRNLVIAAVILVCGLGFSGGLTFGGRNLGYPDRSCDRSDCGRSAQCDSSG